MEYLGIYAAKKQGLTEDQIGKGHFKKRRIAVSWWDAPINQAVAEMLALRARKEGRQAINDVELRSLIARVKAERETEDQRAADKSFGTVLKALAQVEKSQAEQWKKADALEERIASGTRAATSAGTRAVTQVEERITSSERRIEDELECMKVEMLSEVKYMKGQMQGSQPEVHTRQRFTPGQHPTRRTTTTTPTRTPTPQPQPPQPQQQPQHGVLPLSPYLRGGAAWRW